MLGLGEQPLPPACVPINLGQMASLPATWGLLKGRIGPKGILLSPPCFVPVVPQMILELGFDPRLSDTQTNAEMGRFGTACL